ncbi:hypothetical protein CKO23_24345 [Thiocystis violacea]|nr:hypothetical protein [Thiocystis violacea]
MIGLHDLNLKTPEFARRAHPAGVGDEADLTGDVLGIGRDARRLGRWIEPLLEPGAWLVMPVGRVFLRSHLGAWMQLRVNMKPRAEQTQSAPMHKTQATSAGVNSLLKAMTGRARINS